MKLLAAAKALLLALLVAPVLAQSGAPPAAGNGPFVVPTSAAYAQLTNAAETILADVKATFPAVQTVVLYDRSAFALVPYYQPALQQVRQALEALCQAEGKRAAPHITAPTLTGLGTAAAGLASLVAVTLPAYAIQGQAVKIDTAALISAFAAAAMAARMIVIDPAYLLPATAGPQPPLACAAFEQSDSLAELWRAASLEATNLAANSVGKPAPSALTEYRKLADAYLDPGKGEPLLSKLLTVESLAAPLASPAQVAVVDLHLDSVGIDSTTRTILWWRSTRFSSNVLAHYSLLRAQGSQQQFSLTLVKAAAVNVLLKNMDQKHFATSTNPQGKINGLTR